MSKFFINLILICLFGSVSGQTTQDSTALQTPKTNLKLYKIRMGFDIGNFLWAKYKKDSATGFNLDANLYKDYYFLANFGQETHLTDNNLLNYTTTGRYFKIGIGYNLYHNWLDMNNDIMIGLQYAQANFDYFLHAYRINQPGAIYPPQTIYVDENFLNNKAKWLEISTQIQVETFKHLFLGYNVSIKYLMSTSTINNFDISYIPGFNDKNTYSNFGFGLQYFISYQLTF